jgi:hypothetical protein
LLSSEKIHERLLLLNIADAPAPNTISKYIRPAPETPSGKRSQSWQAFLKNHAKDVWAMDYAVVPSFSFKILYILLVVSRDRRKIKHFAVTPHPTAAWLIQQIREAAPFGRRPSPRVAHLCDFPESAAFRAVAGGIHFLLQPRPSASNVRRRAANSYRYAAGKLR